MNATTTAAGPPIAAGVELIAPAGDWDCARAAIENGADAVYFGLDSGFNARARAANFAAEELPSLMALLHRRGVHGYVTLNTLAFPSELPAVERTVRHVIRCGVDAVLVQDLGVLRLIRAICPELPVHASTQMTLTSAEGIRVVEQLGLQRVVLARELSIREIRQIHQDTAVPLEAFVHGALCVAYSGQCLTSESLGGRSANRGECAQACRLPYELVCDGRDMDLGAVRYLLSPQDLAAYALIPELLAAGVSCFKIEGRLKKPEYVANITRHYRRAIDAAVAGQPVEFSPRDVEEMELSFSRGFSPGWLRGCDHKRLVPGLSSAKRGVVLGRVERIGGRRVAVALQSAVAPGDGIVFEGDRAAGDEQGGRVFAVYRGAQRLEEPVREGTVELLFERAAIDPRRLWAGQRLWKTDDPQLTSRLRKTFSQPDPQRRVPLDLLVAAAVGQPLRIVAQADNGGTARVASADPLAAAVRHPLTDAVLQQQLGRLGGTAYELRRLEAHIDAAPMVPLSVLGQLRHELVRQLDASASSVAERVVAAGDALAGLRAADRVLPEIVVGTRRHDDRRPPRHVKTPLPNPLPGVPGRGDFRRSVPSPYSEWAVDDSLPPVLHVLCRTLPQLEAALREGVTSVLADFQDIRQYRHAVSAARAAGAELFLATPRIQKPGECGIFRALERQDADGMLVRNLGGAAFCAEQAVPFIADFSLNAANDLTVHYLRGLGARRLTVSYDLNRDQLLELVQAVPPATLEVVVHQHMPLFHMQHCVFCAVLSPGTNRTDCGRPCDRQRVQLRDRLGMAHSLHADVGCRNTLYNAVPQSAAEAVPTLLARGVRNFRIEFLEDGADAVRQTVTLYRELLAGRTSGRDVWRRLQAANRVGVTRGTLEARRDPLAIL